MFSQFHIANQFNCVYSLRSGFITDAAPQGISLPESIALSRHISLTSALGYYRADQIQDIAPARLTVTKSGVQMG